jgi:hypothetical protein
MRIPPVARIVAGATVLGFVVHAGLPAHAQRYEERQQVTLHDLIRLQDDVDRLDPDRRLAARFALDEAMGRVNEPDDRPSIAAQYNNIIAILNGESPYETYDTAVGEVTVGDR